MNTVVDTTYIDLMKKRRSIRKIGDQLTFGTHEIADLIEKAIKESPTAFNNQSTRAMILFGQSSDKVWEITADRLKSEVPNADAYAATKAKLNAFKAGFGTILFFTDRPTIAQNEKQFALYADNFADWAEQGLGGAQLSVWTALALNQIGASNQHYNPLIDDQVKQAFDVPNGWVLRSEMPFGSIEETAAAKDYIDDDSRFKIIAD